MYETIVNIQKTIEHKFQVGDVVLPVSPFQQFSTPLIIKRVLFYEEQDDNPCYEVEYKLTGEFHVFTQYWVEAYYTLEPKDDDTVTVELVEVIDTINFSKTEWQKILDAAKVKNITVEEFINGAITQQLKAEEFIKDLDPLPQYR